VQFKTNAGFGSGFDVWGRVDYTSPAGVVNVVFSAEATPWVHPRLGLAESEIKEAISWLLIWI
jgi:hypothetical protein